MPFCCPRISRILDIEPFIISILWTTAEIRRNDFIPLFGQWKADNDRQLFPLFDFNTFKQVAVSPTHTLHWPTVPIQFKLARRTIEGVLDLDPDELFRQSTLVRRTEHIAIGSLLRKARQDAGLSQLDLATSATSSK